MQVWGVQHLHRCNSGVIDWVTWVLHTTETGAVEDLRGLAKDFGLGEPSPHSGEGGWLAQASGDEMRLRAVPIDVVGDV